MEIWKDIPEYEGLYQVSNQGRVKSLFRYKKVLKPNILKNGYETVELFKNKSSRRMLVHRLVAMAFIENPNNLPQVNHKDENKQNNFVENLEWVTAIENMSYGTRLARQISNTNYSSELRKNIARENGKTTSKSVIQYSKNGEFISRFDSAKEASRKTGANHAHILECCHGLRYKTVNGFIWKFERGSDLLASQF